MSHCGLLRTKAAKEFVYRYRFNMLKLMDREISRNYMTALINAFFHAFNMVIYIIGFKYGAHLVAEGEISFEDMFLAVMCIVLGAQGASQSGGWLPDVMRSKAAAAEMFQLIDRKPKIVCGDLRICGCPAICSSVDPNDEKDNEKDGNEKDETKDTPTLVENAGTIYDLKYQTPQDLAEAKAAQKEREKKLAVIHVRRANLANLKLIQETKLKKEIDRRKKAVIKNHKNIKDRKPHRQEESLKILEKSEENKQLKKLIEEKEFDKIREKNLLTKEFLENTDADLLMHGLRYHLLKRKWFDWAANYRKGGLLHNARAGGA